MQRRDSGFTFIEILVVMGIIATLMGMVAVIVPRVLERQRVVQSTNNVRQIALLISGRSIERQWPAYSGKGFTLSLVADGIIDPSEPRNLEIFFSPGDAVYSLRNASPERYLEVTPEALRAGSSFRELTSYAGRRNAPGDRPYILTPTKLMRSDPILCDDDDGPCHHPAGLVMGFTDGSARLVEWSELGMARPRDLDNPDPFLGEHATDEAGRLSALSSD